MPRAVLVVNYSRGPGSRSGFWSPWESTFLGFLPHSVMLFPKGTEYFAGAPARGPPFSNLGCSFTTEADRHVEGSHPAGPQQSELRHEDTQADPGAGWHGELKPWAWARDQHESQPLPRPSGWPFRSWAADQSNRRHSQSCPLAGVAVRIRDDSLQQVLQNLQNAS